MSTDPAELERSWRLVESRGHIDGVTVVADPLGVSIESQPLLVGVDGEGNRHLLIPIDHLREVEKATRGAAVGLVGRTLIFDGSESAYVDVSCSRPDLFDQFSVLASQIVSGVAADATAPARTASRILNEWRELLRALSVPTLDRTALIGLFGELRILERVLQVDARRRTDCWTGPTRSRHDFHRGGLVLDVKGTTARRGRPVVIHGIDQLEAPADTELFVWWIQLEVAVGRGESLRTLAHRLLDQVLDPADLELKLRQAGYDFENEETYDTPLLTELDTRLYRVDDSFPSLTRLHLVAGDLPPRVISVTYEIDLSGNMPDPVTAEIEAEVLWRLGGVD